MSCQVCATSLDPASEAHLCTACLAVAGRSPEVARPASTSALWLWTSPDAEAALATGDLGTMIRTWRNSTGASQHVLAEQLGYDSSYISMIENGRRDVVDVVNRRRIAQYLGIPLHRVGVTGTDSADHVAMLQFGYSTIRLAALARRQGHGVTAVNELWPLVARLEARVAEGMIDRAILPLLARARAELGVSLGYVLPEERLGYAVRWTGRAVRIAQHLDDELHSYCLRTHGNELRKADRVPAATVRLAQAAALATPAQRPATLVQLARVALDATTFDATFEQLRRSSDDSPADDPMVGDTALREVRLRGLAATGRIRLAAALIHNDTPTRSLAPPQWQVIEQITVAEVLFALGDAAVAESLLTQALETSQLYRLPHQVQRAARIAAHHSPKLVAHSSQILAKIVPHAN